ncbi:MAG: hypothetical protein IPM46_07885 [Flavobacteriales bacterium]|nr:hypothetical protein [Flavobacteriales bacterium]
MSDKEQEPTPAEPEVPTPLSEFLESASPNQFRSVSELCKREWTGVEYKPALAAPEIQLHCPSEHCNGMRFFRRKSEHSIYLEKDGWTLDYVTYLCSNCQTEEKIFSMAIELKEYNGTTTSVQGIATCYKFGELPTFGPPVPARLISLIGPDREIFLKGRRCENQGLGIGAFIYYRRVVENQKKRILSEILKVLEKVDGSPDKIEKVKKAIDETQFKKALEMVKDAIPQVLLINGYNPMTLLHGALSDGVHERSDEHCMELATSIRVVLGELSERLSQALKDEAELQKALSHLIHAKQPAATKAKDNGVKAQ